MHSKSSEGGTKRAHNSYAISGARLLFFACKVACAKVIGATSSGGFLFTTALPSVLIARPTSIRNMFPNGCRSRRNDVMQRRLRNKITNHLWPEISPALLGALR